MEYRANGKIRLRSASGLYLRVDPETDVNVSAVSEADEFCDWDYIPQRREGFMLRTFNGNYIGKSEDIMKADAPFMRQAAVFGFEYRSRPYQRKKSFSESMKRIKKRLLFIKSKLLQS